MISYFMLAPTFIAIRGKLKNGRITTTFILGRASKIMCKKIVYKRWVIESAAKSEYDVDDLEM